MRFSGLTATVVCWGNSAVVFVPRPCSIPIYGQAATTTHCGSSLPCPEQRKSSLRQNQLSVPIRDTPSNLVIQRTAQAACGSDKSTFTEDANLSNSLPNLGFVTICRANVERTQPFTPQQLRDENRRDAYL